MRLAAPQLAAALFAALGLACATPARVDHLEGEDLAGLSRWDWLPHSPRVEAAAGRVAQLQPRLMQLVEEALGEKGFVRAPGRAEFFVTLRLDLERRDVLVDVPSAPYLLSSMSSSASYWVEGPRQERRSVEDARLSFGVSDSQGVWLWRARLVRQLDDGAELPLKRDLTRLLRRFPQREADGDPDGATDPPMVAGRRSPPGG